MNTRKIIGLLCWLLAFLVPFQSALLSTEDVNNVKGLISFVVMVGLIFTGYALVDGANVKKTADGHGH